MEYYVTEDGIQFPTHTSAERNAFVAPPNGFVFYNTDTNQLEQNRGDGVTPSFEQMGGTISGASFISSEGVLTPPEITSNQDNYNPTGWLDSGVPQVTLMNCFADSGDKDLTGIQAPSPGVICILYLYNEGGDKIKLKNNSGSSSAANRFDLKADINLDDKKGIILMYDTSKSRWVNFSKS